MKFTKGVGDDKTEWLRSRDRGISMLLSYDGDDTHVGWTVRTAGITQPELERILRDGNKAISRVFRKHGVSGSKRGKR